MTDTRPYIRLHDGMPEHPKTVGLADAAFRLLVETWCFCSRSKNDGRMKAGVWANRGSAKSRAALVAEGLVEVLDNGDITMHDYLEHQRSAAEIADLAERRRAAGQAGGLARARASARAKAKPSPSKNVAYTEDKELEESSSRGARKRPTPPPDIMPITEEMRVWAEEHAPDVRLVVQTAKLLDWARGKGEKKADWLAAWRNWMRSEQEKLSANGRKAGVGNGVYDDDEEVWMR